MTEIQYILLGFALTAISFIYVHYLIDRVKKSLKILVKDMVAASMILTLLLKSKEVEEDKDK